MPRRIIATTLKTEGEKEFKQQMAAAARSVTQLDSELRLAAAQFDTTGDKEAFLTKKTDLLSKQMEQQEEVVAALSREQATIIKRYGEGSVRADGFAKQLTNARTRLEKMRKESQKAEGEMKDLKTEMDDASDEAKELGKSLASDLARGAEEAKSDIQSLTDTLESLRNMKAVEIGVNLAGKAWEMAQNLMDFVDEYQEENRQQVWSQYRAEATGYNYDDIWSMIKGTASVTGDLEGARGGIGMLSAIRLPLETLQAVADNLLGISMMFPEYDFNSLAESFQESANKGGLEGAFYESLGRMGYTDVQMDAWREELNAMASPLDRVEKMMTLISGNPQDLSFVGLLARYQNEQQEQVDYQKAQIEMQQAWAELAETLTPAATWIVEKLTDLVNVVNRIFGWISRDEGDVLEAIKPVLESDAFDDATKNSTVGLVAPNTAISEAMGREATAGEAASMRAASIADLVFNAPGRMVKQAFEKALDALPNKTLLDPRTAWQAMQEERGSDPFFFAPERMQKQAVENALDSSKDAIGFDDTRSKADDHMAVMEEWARKYEETMENAAMYKPQAMEDWKATYQGVMDDYQTNGFDPVQIDILQNEYDMLMEKVIETEKSMESEAAKSGANIASNLAASLNAGAPEATAAAQRLVDDLNAILGSVTYPAFGGYNVSAGSGRTSGGGTMYNSPIYLDGRRVGQMLTPYVSQAQGRAIG